MVGPASTKVRRSDVKTEWFYNPHAKSSTRKVGDEIVQVPAQSWRFLPVDLSHQASYDRVDPVTREPAQPARPYEIKGWVPAAMAIQNIPGAKESAPEAVRRRYNLPDPEPTPKKADADGKAA